MLNIKILILTVLLFLINFFTFSQDEEYISVKANPIMSPASFLYETFNK